MRKLILMQGPGAPGKAAQWWPRSASTLCASSSSVTPTAFLRDEKFSLRKYQQWNLSWKWNNLIILTPHESPRCHSRPNRNWHNPTRQQAPKQNAYHPRQWRAFVVPSDAKRNIFHVEKNNYLTQAATV